jgi:hypothetical protein
MNPVPGFGADPGRTWGIARYGRWRLILLILGFNILLIITLLLSLQHDELAGEYQLLIETRVHYEELLITQEVIEPVTVTVVVAPGFTPQATPVKP